MQTVNHTDDVSLSTCHLSFLTTHAPPTYTYSTPLQATEGLPSTNVVVMTFIDANPFATASDFSVGSVDWDGTLEGATPSLSVVGDSFYSGPGSGWKVVADSVT